MNYEYTIIRDIKGNIRIPEGIKNGLRFTNEQTKQLIEQMFILTGKDIGVRQLQTTLEEYDEMNNIKIKKGPGRKWTDEEDEYVLLHHEDGDEEVAKELGRTGMSIYMHKAQLLSEYDTWKNKHQTILNDKTREQIVKLYMKRAGYI